MGFEVPARSDEQMARDRECTVQVFSIEKFTCDDCPAVRTCGFAFDPYNTDGDCLAEK